MVMVLGRLWIPRWRSPQLHSNAWDPTVLQREGESVAVVGKIVRYVARV